MVVARRARASPSLRGEAFRTAKEIAREFAARGAQAVVLLGSWVRGDAYPESDLDLVAVGRGPEYLLWRRGPFLVAESWRTAAFWRQEFRDPAAVGGAIPAWRKARVIWDPNGVAARLKRQAKAWTWDEVPRADAWVAEEFTGYAEEVHRLLGNLRLRRRTAAAVVRSVLAMRLAPILAVRHRILYDTENRLWDLVAAKMGPRWKRAQAAALGLSPVPLGIGARAALESFALAAEDVRPLLDRRQEEVVSRACALAGHSWR